jgi:D-alanyl-D-alanine carboxypeptidase/D-alanyl-D-alanine-endopeptidase (penicillin-binding protein 4)
MLRIALILLSLAAPTFGASAGPEQGLQAFLGHPAIRGARVGVLVEDLDSGTRLLAHQSDRALVPASNQKLLVSAAALSHWGPAHRFETPVMIDGKVDSGGVLHGTLWIVGKGDPSHVSESIWKLAEEVRMHGIEEIRGGLGIDASYFDSIRFHPDWAPVLTLTEQRPTSGFAVNYSAFQISVIGGDEVGQPARVQVAPETPYFRARSDAVTIQQARRLQLQLTPLPDGSGERVLVTGAFPLGNKPLSYWRSVSMPSRYAAAVLRTQLEAQGVRVRGPTRLSSTPEGAVELFRFKGETVGEIVWKLNKYSNNFIAEQLTKKLGAELYGPPGSWTKGGRALGEFLQGIGIQDRQVVIADGSGLSRRNRVSPQTLVALVRRAARGFASGPEFLASLPLGGLDGTLEDRMENGAIAVRGKTGHLRRVSSLSGIVPGATGRWLAFAILVNGARGNRLEVDAAIDAFVAELGS